MAQMCEVIDEHLSVYDTEELFIVFHHTMGTAISTSLERVRLTNANLLQQQLLLLLQATFFAVLTIDAELLECDFVRNTTDVID